VTRVLVLCLALSTLAACTGEDKPTAAPAAPTVLSDQQQQALKQAEALREQHAEQRKAQLDAQMEKAEGQ
jgi:hypothetical protein